MIGRIGIARSLVASTMLCVGLAGCSDGIEVNSKLLDYAGASSTGSHMEPQLQERQGLVVPPPMASLPEPGSGVAVAADVSSQLPRNPETVVIVAAAEKKRREAEACAKAAHNHDDPGLQAACPGLFAKFTPATQDNAAQ